jgi:hypothetical protein
MPSDAEGTCIVWKVRGSEVYNDAISRAQPTGKVNICRDNLRIREVDCQGVRKTRRRHGTEPRKPDPREILLLQMLKRSKNNGESRQIEV